MASNIEILQTLDKFSHPEKRWTVSRVDNKIGQEEIRRFYRWFQDKESSRHFDPLITSLRECEEYYSQKENVFLVARNHYGEPIGVLTVKGEPFLKDSGDRNIAYIEKMIVRPDIQGKGIGKTFITTALNYVFGEESRVQWDECRLWIMTD